MLKALLAMPVMALVAVVACSSSSPSQCYGGCLCTTSQSDCKAPGCKWVNGACANVFTPLPSDGGGE